MNDSSALIAAIESGDYSDSVLYGCLQLSDEAQMRLFEIAQKRRLEHFPDNSCQVRSVIEISNICRQKCRYCAIGGNSQAKNYTLDASQIEMLAIYLYNKGRRVIFLQSGENVNEKFVLGVTEAVGNIKRKYKINIVITLGEF